MSGTFKDTQKERIYLDQPAGVGSRTTIREDLKVRATVKGLGPRTIINLIKNYTQHNSEFTLADGLTESVIRNIFHDRKTVTADKNHIKCLYDIIECHNSESALKQKNRALLDKLVHGQTRRERIIGQLATMNGASAFYNWLTEEQELPAGFNEAKMNSWKNPRYTTADRSELALMWRSARKFKKLVLDNPASEGQTVGSTLNDGNITIKEKPSISIAAVSSPVTGRASFISVATRMAAAPLQTSFTNVTAVPVASVGRNQTNANHIFESVAQHKSNRDQRSEWQVSRDENDDTLLPSGEEFDDLALHR